MNKRGFGLVEIAGLMMVITFGVILIMIASFQLQDDTPISLEAEAYVQEIQLEYLLQGVLRSQITEAVSDMTIEDPTLAEYLASRDYSTPFSDEEKRIIEETFKDNLEPIVEDFRTVDLNKIFRVKLERTNTLSLEYFVRLEPANGETFDFYNRDTICSPSSVQMPQHIHKTLYTAIPTTDKNLNVQIIFFPVIWQDGICEPVTLLKRLDQ